MKVNDLEGRALDFWVAKALGYTDIMFIQFIDGDPSSTSLYCNDEDRDTIIFQPSLDPALALYILQKHVHMLVKLGNGWLGTVRDEENTYMGYSENIAEAGLRALVASVFGDEINNEQFYEALGEER